MDSGLERECAKGETETMSHKRKVKVEVEETKNIKVEGYCYSCRNYCEEERSATRDDIKNEVKSERCEIKSEVKRESSEIKNEYRVLRNYIQKDENGGSVPQIFGFPSLKMSEFWHVLS